MKVILLAGVVLSGGCVASRREVLPAPVDMVSAAEAVVVVDRDDVVIDEARVAGLVRRELVLRFGEGVVPDTNGNGVVQVTASNVVIRCEGTLRGAQAGDLPVAFAGTAVWMEGANNVALCGLKATGFKVGLRATGADGLTVQKADFDNLWRMRLKSTPEKEHNDDWLWPHENDRQEWVTNYGAAVCIERSTGVKVSEVKVRNGQNGIILDRVEQGMVFDNDCSFLSGWGVAMWRSSRNIVSRNALDFCVRGYSHGKYNRGQDSAGLLMFEQCSGNTVVENSMTHCGDGVFVFAGKEALGEKKVEGMDYARRGCNDNVFVRNDLSFSAAHGLEVTFSFGNRIEGNLFEGNAICGIWGGYSQETLILSNRFISNGPPGGGGAGEGGGVNIEHGYRNVISECRFYANSAGVKLWDDDDGALLKTPWAAANHRGCRENRFVNCRVDQRGGSAVCVRRTVDTEVTGISLGSLHDEAVQAVDADSESTFVPAAPATPATPRVEPLGSVEAVGDRHPVDAKDAWWGREWIVMNEWGPREPGHGERPATKRGEAAKTPRRTFPVIHTTPARGLAK